MRRWRRKEEKREKKKILGNLYISDKNRDADMFLSDIKRVWPRSYTL